MDWKLVSSLALAVVAVIVAIVGWRFYLLQLKKDRDRKRKLEEVLKDYELVIQGTEFEDEFELLRISFESYLRCSKVIRLGDMLIEDTKLSKIYEEEDDDELDRLIEVQLEGKLE